MNKKNTNKKSTKPTFVVDITNCADEYDVAFNIAMAKQEANLPLSEDNLDIICTVVVDAFLNKLAEMGYLVKDKHYVEPVIHSICFCDGKNKSEKKGNIFKRFWKWLFGRK